MTPTQTSGPSSQPSSHLQFPSPRPTSAVTAPPNTANISPPSSTACQALGGMGGPISGGGQGRPSIGWSQPAVRTDRPPVTPTSPGQHPSPAEPPLPPPSPSTATPAADLSRSLAATPPPQPSVLLISPDQVSCNIIFPS